MLLSPKKDIDTSYQGVAAGSHYDVIDIIALNVRTEIAFGLFSDGCTSLYIKTEDKAFLGQNWDVSSTTLVAGMGS